MAHVRKNQLTPSPEWAKHLRPHGKRAFWSVERRAQQAAVRKALADARADSKD